MTGFRTRLVDLRFPKPGITFRDDSRRSKPSIYWDHFRISTTRTNIDFSLISTGVETHGENQEVSTL